MYSLSSGRGAPKSEAREHLDIKVADFGSAGILEGKECLLTIHGSPSYVAPEVLLGKGYGPKVDVWAVGVIIKKGEYSFPDDVWKTIDPTGEGSIDFIKKLLVVDPKQRLSAGDILLHPWVSKHVHPMDSLLPKPATPIVFPRTFRAYPTPASKEFLAGEGSVSRSKAWTGLVLCAHYLPLPSHPPHLPPVFLLRPCPSSPEDSMSQMPRKRSLCPVASTLCPP
eukprot:g41617.t1